MKYLMLVCRDAEDSPLAPTQADLRRPDVAQWWQAANDAGKYVMGDRLRPAAEAMSVRVRAGELLVTQGPFTEASELVAGFDVLECDTMQQAVEIAAGHAMAHAGVIGSERCGRSTASKGLRIGIIPVATGCGREGTAAWPRESEQICR